MGGSGGSFSSAFNPSKSASQIREAENQSLDKTYETDVNSSLNDILTELNIDL
jgi:hypothetical protein